VKSEKAEYSMRARDEDSESESESDSDVEIDEDDLRLLKNARIRLERPPKIKEGFRFIISTLRVKNINIPDEIARLITLAFVGVGASLGIQIPKKRILSKVRLWF
jgi:hypothetical protein